jgi:hypothetical protein
MHHHSSPKSIRAAPLAIIIPDLKNDETTTKFYAKVIARIFIDVDITPIRVQG